MKLSKMSSDSAFQYVLVCTSRGVRVVMYTKIVLACEGLMVLSLIGVMSSRWVEHRP